MPSICCSIPDRAPSVVIFSAGSSEAPSSPSSEIAGTVGLERPNAMGPWLRGVFWGVGAVMPGPEIGTLEDIVSILFFSFIPFVVEVSWRFNSKGKEKGKVVDRTQIGKKTGVSIWHMIQYTRAVPISAEITKSQNLNSLTCLLRLGNAR